MTNEIVSGEDIMGALLMGHSYNSWWTGSALSIEEARSLAPGQNATTLQVAAGIVAAILWMLENRGKALKHLRTCPPMILSWILPDRTSGNLFRHLRTGHHSKTAKYFSKKAPPP